MGGHTSGVSCPACVGLAFRTDYTWASHEVICFDCGYHYEHDGSVFIFRDLISRLVISGGSLRDAGKALCAGRVDFCIVIDMDERGFLVKTEPCSAEDFDLELNEEIRGGNGSRSGSAGESPALLPASVRL